MGKFDGIRLEASVVRVIDGDTVEFLAESLFKGKYQDSFRFLGINAPEKKGETKDAGLAARDFVAQMLPVGKKVELDVYKQEKYGRWLAIVYVDGVNLNDLLVEKGFAKPYMV